MRWKIYTFSQDRRRQCSTTMIPAYRLYRSETWSRSTTSSPYLPPGGMTKKLSISGLMWTQHGKADGMKCTFWNTDSSSRSGQNRLGKACSDPPGPGNTQRFFLPVVPMRDLAIANFSVILARLIHALKLTEPKFLRRSREGGASSRQIWFRHYQSCVERVRYTGKDPSRDARFPRSRINDFTLRSAPDSKGGVGRSRCPRGTIIFEWVKHTPFVLGTRKLCSFMRISTSPPCIQASAKWKGRSRHTDSMSLANSLTV